MCEKVGLCITGPSLPSIISPDNTRMRSDQPPSGSCPWEKLILLFDNLDLGGIGVVKGGGVVSSSQR